jgi:hypothetical protein
MLPISGPLFSVGIFYSYGFNVSYSENICEPGNTKMLNTVGKKFVFHGNGLCS